MAAKSRGKRKRSSPGRPKRASRLQRDAIPRAVLGRELQRQIKRFGLTREVTALIVGDAATQMSRLMSGHFAEFSADRLVRFLTRLGSDVNITIRHSRKLGRGHVRIKVT